MNLNLKERKIDGTILDLDLLGPALLLALALTLAALALFFLPAAASAQMPDARQPVVLTVAAPEDVPLGNLARVVVVLREDAGKPMAKARIVFTSPAAFTGVVGEMAIGEALTDGEGVATLDHELRIQGQNQIVARYYGDENHQPAEASAVVLATGEAQLLQRSVGLQVPLVGPWILMVVIGGVWSVYFAALLLVAGIPERPQPIPETGGKR